MSARLTDAELDEAFAYATHSLRLTAALSELRERREADDRIAECLVRIFHLYGGFNVDNRGPRGCIWDALEMVAPQITKEIEESDWDTVYGKHWGDEP